MIKDGYQLQQQQQVLKLLLIQMIKYGSEVVIHHMALLHHLIVHLVIQRLDLKLKEI